MSIKAKLLLDDQEINVLRFSFLFNQGSDETGRHSQNPLFMGLEITIETQSDLHLAEWAAAANQTKQLALHIYPVIMGGRIRKIYFYDCHLLRWENSFSSIGDQPLSETLQISAAGVRDTDSAGEYSAYWRETFDGVAVGATTLGEEEEKEFTSCYITDKDGNEINDFEIGEIIVLNIETKNRIGDSLTVNLEDKTHDFKYNGTLLENDMLINYVVHSDLEKVELEVVAQIETI